MSEFAVRLRRAGLLLSAVVAVPLAVAVPASAATPPGRTAATPPGAAAAPHACAAVDPAVAGRGTHDVIVLGRPGAEAAVHRAVVRAGGTVRHELPIIDGVQARVSPAALARLACAPSVAGVSADSKVTFQSVDNDVADAAVQTNGVSDYLDAIGASRYNANGIDGHGVGVAVIDTGISPMPDFAGRVVYGPDLSGEGRLVDSYGHGTVMAGIIGGDGTDSNGAHRGVAPGATLISVKVAGRNGAVDVSTILQAMHWVAAYRKEFNIRVLNLSWGTPSTQSPSVDPLDYAVERLWRLGVVVVAAAGNSGPQPGSILKPGDDPLVLTVGAYDEGGTGLHYDDTVPAWSSVGPTANGDAKPDLVAPGRTLVAERSYGSLVEQNNPQALVAPSYIKGSGTSEATAVTSGAVALLLQARPNLTPDQVKHVLTHTAKPLRSATVAQQGNGRLTLDKMLTAKVGTKIQQTGAATGLGSIEASRGGHNVTTDCHEDGTMDVIVGEIDVRCEAWNPAAWTGASWTGASWTGASWAGASWTGSSWTGASWTGASWTGASWTGGDWAGGSWAGSAWTGASWTGSSWTGASWTGASWTGASWTGASWTSDEWASSQGAPTSFQTAWWGDTPPVTSRYFATD